MHAHLRTIWNDPAALQRHAWYIQTCLDAGAGDDDPQGYADGLAELTLVEDRFVELIDEEADRRSAHNPLDDWPDNPAMHESPPF